MGNNSSAIYKDPSQWSKEDFESFIREAILSNPWNPICDSKQLLTDDEKLRETIAFMREQGVRPITAAEYSLELQTMRSPNNGGRLRDAGKILLWKPLLETEYYNGYISNTNSSSDSSCVSWISDSESKGCPSSDHIYKGAEDKHNYNNNNDCQQQQQQQCSKSSDTLTSPMYSVGYNAHASSVVGAADQKIDNNNNHNGSTMTFDDVAAARQRFLKKIRLENPLQAQQLEDALSLQPDFEHK